MSDEEKVYTKGEMELLLATNEVKTMQKIMLDSFSEHMQDDISNFKRLYDANKEIISKIETIPQKMADCSDKMKKEVLSVADRRYTPIIEFKVFRTQVITGIVIGTVIGSAIATIINLAISATKLIGG